MPVDKIVNQPKTEGRKRAAAIIIKDNKLLVIKRHCENHDIVDYYVLPGGGIEKHETPVQAIIREAKEEVSIDVKLDKLLFKFVNFGAMEHYYLVTSFTGNVAPANEITTQEPTDTKDINLLPEKAKTLIIEYTSRYGI